MKNITIKSMLFVAIMLLNGCLESSDNEKEPTVQENEPQSKVAYYHTNEKALEGIYYECGINSGITDENGAFLFEVGEDCNFYLLEKEEFLLKELFASLLKEGVIIQEEDENLNTFLDAVSTENSGVLQINQERIERLAEINIVELPSLSEEIERIQDLITQESKEEMEQRLGVIVQEYANMSLTWEDTPHTIEAGNWYDAMNYCSQLEHAGLSDWRLPEKETLVSLDISRFTHKVLGSYWSATEFQAFEGASDFLEAYLIDFVTGNGVERGYVLKTNDNPFSRCVSTSTPHDMRNITPQESVSLIPSCEKSSITQIGEIGYGSFKEATGYCSSINASLPTIEQIHYLYEQNSTHPNNSVGLWSATVTEEEGTHLSVYFTKEGIEETPMLDENGRSYLCVESSCN